MNIIEFVRVYRFYRRFNRPSQALRIAWQAVK